VLIRPAALFGTRKRPYERLGCQISRHHVRSFRVVGDVFIDDSSVLAECNFIWRAHHPLFSGALYEVSTAFDKGTADNDEVRGMGDKEIALFNELGIVHRKGQREMVTLVPHAAILMWILCRKSIFRRRQDTGPWYAATLIRFTLESVNYVLKFNRDFYLRDKPDSDEGMIAVTVKDLRSMRDQLKAELRNN